MSWHGAKNIPSTGWLLVKVKLRKSIMYKIILFLFALKL